MVWSNEKGIAIMGNYAWVLEVRPGYEDEYKKRHNEIWPELISELTAAGIRNYNIFRYGLTLFGYFETDDLDKAVAYLTCSEINRRWGEYMAPIMKLDSDKSTGFPFLLPLQWRMD